MKTLQILLLASVFAIAKPQPASVVPDHFKTGLGKVYQGYLNIQQALANDDLQKARTGSDSMLASLKGIRTKGLDGMAKSHWDSSSTGMMNALHPMVSAKDLEVMRSHFKELTPLVTDAIERFGMKSASPAYLFHCPMANANWLQKDKEKANPFYGKAMLECGSLIREVKAH